MKKNLMIIASLLLVMIYQSYSDIEYSQDIQYMYDGILHNETYFDNYNSNYYMLKNNGYTTTIDVFPVNLIINSNLNSITFGNPIPLNDCKQYIGEAIYGFKINSLGQFLVLTSSQLITYSNNGQKINNQSWLLPLSFTEPTFPLQYSPFTIDDSNRIYITPTHQNYIWIYSMNGVPLDTIFINPSGTCNSYKPVGLVITPEQKLWAVCSDNGYQISQLMCFSQYPEFSIIHNYCRTGSETIQGLATSGDDYLYWGQIIANSFHLIFHQWGYNGNTDRIIVLNNDGSNVDNIITTTFQNLERGTNSIRMPNGLFIKNDTLIYIDLPNGTEAPQKHDINVRIGLGIIDTLETPVVTLETNINSIKLTWRKNKIYEVKYKIVKKFINQSDEQYIEVVSDYTDTTFTVFDIIQDSSYCFRVKASLNNTYTSSWSETKCGQLDDIAPPTNLQLTTGNNQIELSWNASLTTEVRYRIFRSQNESNYNIIIDNLETLNFIDTSVDNGINYCYVVKATKYGKVSANSNIACGIPQDTEVLPPTNLILTTGDKQLKLDWTASATQGIQYYNVYRKLPSEANFPSNPFKSNITVLTFIDTNVVNNIEYCYVVRAFKNNIESEKSNIACEIPQDTVVLSPTNLILTSGNKQIKLDWTASATQGIQYYNIYRKLSSEADFPSNPYKSNITVLTFIDTNVFNNIEYCYVVRAFKNNIESANSNIACGSPQDTVVLPPTNLILTTGNKQIELDWTASATQGIQYYNIYKKLSSEANFQSNPHKSNIIVLTFIDTNVFNEIEYCYLVRAFKNNIESENSNIACGSPQDTVVLSTTNLILNLLNQSFKITWQPSETEGVTYSVYRTKYESGGNYENIVPIAEDITELEYTDTDVEIGVKHFYIVRAKKNGQYSENSNEVEGFIQLPDFLNLIDELLLKVKKLENILQDEENLNIIQLELLKILKTYFSYPNGYNNTNELKEYLNSLKIKQIKNNYEVEIQALLRLKMVLNSIDDSYQSDYIPGSHEISSEVTTIAADMISTLITLALSIEELEPLNIDELVKNQLKNVLISCALITKDMFIDFLNIFDENSAFIEGGIEICNIIANEDKDKNKIVNKLQEIGINLIPVAIDVIKPYFRNLLLSSHLELNNELFSKSKELSESLNFDKENYNQALSCVSNHLDTIQGITINFEKLYNWRNITTQFSNLMTDILYLAAYVDGGTVSLGIAIEFKLLVTSGSIIADRIHFIHRYDFLMNGPNAKFIWGFEEKYQPLPLMLERCYTSSYNPPSSGIIQKLHPLYQIQNIDFESFSFTDNQIIYNDSIKVSELKRKVEQSDFDGIVNLKEDITKSGKLAQNEINNLTKAIEGIPIEELLQDSILNNKYKEIKESVLMLGTYREMISSCIYLFMYEPNYPGKKDTIINFINLYFESLSLVENSYNQFIALNNEKVTQPVIVLSSLQVDSLSSDNYRLRAYFKNFGAGMVNNQYLKLVINADTFSIVTKNPVEFSKLLYNESSNYEFDALIKSNTNKAYIRFYLEDIEGNSKSIGIQEVNLKEIINSIEKSETIKYLPLSLSPNPINDNSLNILLNLSTPEQVTIEIVNMLGEVVSVVKANEFFSGGEHSMNADISNFPAGAYFCILRYKDKVYQQQFIRYK